MDHKFLYALREKCFWLHDKPCMHNLFHLLITGKVVFSWHISWVDQTCDNLRGPGQDCTKGSPTPHISGASGCQQLNNAKPCYHSPEFCSNSWSHLVPQHLIITDVYCCHVPVVIVFQSWSLWVPEMCQDHFPCWWLHFELLFYWRCHMFPFHTLIFTSWLVVVGPCLVPSDNASQECLMFMTTVIQRTSADSQTVAFLILYEFWHPSYSHFIKAKSSVNDFMGKDMTNVQMMGHFIHSDPATTQNHGTDSFNIFISTVSGWASCHWWNLHIRFYTW